MQIYATIIYNTIFIDKFLFKVFLLLLLFITFLPLQAQKYIYLSKGYFTENEVSEMIKDKYAENLIWLKVYKVNNIDIKDFYKIMVDTEREKYYSAYQITGFKFNCKEGTASIVKNSYYIISSGTAVLKRTEEPKNHTMYIEPNESPLYKMYNLNCSKK